jgi:radical SAM protein with 4Fe4S-binding SPASM domain
MSSDIYSLLSVLNNKVVRRSIKSSSKKCQICGKSHLEVALDDFVGRKPEKRPCIKGRLASKVIKTAISNSGKAFGVTIEQLKQGLMDSYVRRGMSNILVGISNFGISKPQTSGAPLLVVWNYTNACNLQCKHCYQNADKPTPGELSTEQRKRIVDQMAQENVVAVAFSGGEPLMSRDFFEVVEYAQNSGLYVSVATNGTLINRAVAEKMKKVGVGYVDISLDGANAETHDSFRGVPGCFDKTVSGIKNLAKEGIYTCLATTATKNNLNEIPDIIKLGKELKVKRITVFNFIPTGRAQAILDFDLSPEERERLLEFLYDELLKGEINTVSTAPQFARVCLTKSQEGNRDMLAPTHFCAYNLPGKVKYLTDFIGGCGAGRIYCALQPEGLVTPCVFMPIVVGDLKQQTLEEIWLNSPVLADLRNREKLKGRCGQCQYKYICGGCRARAYGYYQDYLAPDPGCIRELDETSIQFTKVPMF